MYAEHQYDFTYQSDDGLVVMVNNPEEYSMVPSFPGEPKIKYVGLNDFRLNYFNVGDEFLFRYDFGDGWEIKLKIEQLDDQLNDFGTMLPELLFDVVDVYTLNYYNQDELN